MVVVVGYGTPRLFSLPVRNGGFESGVLTLYIELP